jgi:hypothetical protein
MGGINMKYARLGMIFSFLALSLTGCHLTAEKNTSISTNVPKGYAPASAVKSVAWEDKVDAAMKLGTEAQAEGLPVARIEPVVSPVKPATVAAHATYHPKRALSRLHHRRAKARKKAWYDKLLGRK